MTTQAKMKIKEVISVLGLPEGCLADAQAYLNLTNMKLCLKLEFEYTPTNEDMMKIVSEVNKARRTRGGKG